MYEISPLATINSSNFAATNMVLTPLTNIFMVDQHIAALEQEIFTLRSAKKNFNGVEISWPAPKSALKANKLAQTNTPKIQKVLNLCLNQNRQNHLHQHQLNPQYTLSLMSAMCPTSLLMSETLLLHQNQQRTKNRPIKL
jgi:hypothetical protein